MTIPASPPMRVHDKLVKSADGTMLYAQAAGDPSKPALVCIHGFAGTSYSFHKQFADPYLLQNVYLIAYDLRGNGRSDKPEKPEAYEGEPFAEDFRAVCEAFGVTKPFLLGWSLGAILLLDVLNHLPPGYVRGAIYSGGPVPTRPIHATYMSDWLARTLVPVLHPEAAISSAAAVEFLDGCFARPREVTTYEERARWLGEILLAPPQTRVMTEAKTRERDTSKFLERVRDVPLLVFQGSADVMVDPPKLETTLKQIFADKPDFEFEWFEGVGHCPAWERTREHDEKVVRFIQRYT